MSGRKGLWPAWAPSLAQTPRARRRPAASLYEPHGHGSGSSTHARWYVVRYGMLYGVWYGVVWYYVVIMLHGLVRGVLYGIVCFMAWYRMVMHGIVWAEGRP